METAPPEVSDLSILASRGINLTAKPVEILIILGPNGAGKTTLVRQITTELLPTTGSLIVLGYYEAREPTEVKESLGIVLQEAALFDSINT